MIDVDSRPVHGTLIDEYRRPVPNVTLKIDDQASVTDAQGHFSFAGVPATYSISFTIEAAPDAMNTGSIRLWRYEGLTRRDPTLQCDECLAAENTTQITFEFPGSTEGQEFHIAAGGVDISTYWFLKPTTEKSRTIRWRGPPGNLLSLHGVLIQLDATTGQYLFPSFETKNLRLSAAPIEAKFSFPQTTLGTIHVSGRIQPGGLPVRSNKAWLRWEDGASMPLMVNSMLSEEFDIRMPAVPDARVMLSAVAGAVDADGNVVAPAGYVTVDGITETRSDIVLQIPQPAMPVSPAAGAQAGADTVFTWRSASDNVDNASGQLSYLTVSSAGAFVLVFTSGDRARVPAEAWDRVLPRNASLLWQVRTMPRYASVDAAAETGYVGSWVSTTIGGPASGPDSVAISEARAVTSPP